MNDPRIFDRATLDRLQQPTNYLPPWFIGNVLPFESANDPSWPLGRSLGWIEDALDSNTGEYTVLMNRGSNESNGNQFPAALIVPPAAMFVAAATEAGPRYAYQPCVHVMAGRIVNVIGSAPNHSYDVQNLDGAITGTGMIPNDRWPGVDYQEQNPTRLVLLIVADRETLLLWANEPPMFFNCPQPSGAVSQQFASLAGV